jgi:archaellum biogenesis ATPase FlaH
MFDGLEYLIVHNDFDRVLKFLHSLRDEIAVQNSRLIISLNPKTLTGKKVALLSKDLRVLNGH